MTIYPVEIENDHNFRELKPKRLIIPYLREENEGYWSMLTNNGDSNYTMCNKTSMAILDMCDGNNTVGQILTALFDKYPDANRATIERDLIQTLGSLTRLDAIEWKEDNKMSNNPFVLTAVGCINESVILTLAEEDDIRDLNLFFRQFIEHLPINNTTDRYTYFWGNDYREYVSPTMIRQCLYSYYKDFFVLKEHGEIIGVIAVKPAHEAYLNDAVIQLVSVPKNFFSSCIKEILLYYNNFPYKKINALRIQIAKKSSSEEIEIADALEANGVVLESIREKEYCGNQDIYVYSTHITRNN